MHKTITWLNNADSNKNCNIIIIYFCFTVLVKQCKHVLSVADLADVFPRSLSLRKNRNE